METKTEYRVKELKVNGSYDNYLQFKDNITTKKYNFLGLKFGEYINKDIWKFIPKNRNIKKIKCPIILNGEKVLKEYTFNKNKFKDFINKYPIIEQYLKN